MRFREGNPRRFILALHLVEFRRVVAIEAMNTSRPLADAVAGWERWRDRLVGQEEWGVHPHLLLPFATALERAINRAKRIRDRMEGRRPIYRHGLVFRVEVA